MKNSWLRCGAFAAPLLLCVLVAPASLAGWRGALQVDTSSGQLMVYPWPGGARVEAPGAPARDLALPDSAELSSVAALRRGWVVAGSTKTEDGGEILRLYRGTRAGVIEIAAPGYQRDHLRLRPILLARDGEIAGLAWLEGGTMQTLAVWASSWRDGAWSKPELLAAPRPDGGHLALAGALLADGSRVLVWSGYDGTDDEIFYTRFAGGSWQPARRLHADNAVFDITPTVSAFGEDAIVSWSRYDGNTYRLIVARLERDRVVNERMIGESGSVLPRFVPGDGGGDLVYYSAEDSGWRVAELDRHGRVLRRAAAEGHVDHRPLLVRTGIARELVWRHQDREAELSFREEAP